MVICFLLCILLNISMEVSKVCIVPVQEQHISQFKESENDCFKITIKSEVNTALQAMPFKKRVKLLKFIDYNTARCTLRSSPRSSVERNNDYFLTTAGIKIYQFLNHQNKMSPYNFFCFWCYVFALLLVQTNFLLRLFFFHCILPWKSDHEQYHLKPLTH